MQGNRKYETGGLVVYKHCPGVGTIQWVGYKTLILTYPEGHSVLCLAANCTPHTEPEPETK